MTASILYFHGFASSPDSAKITALWGIDYIHLARATPDGKWKIVNVLWQEHPK